MYKCEGGGKGLGGTYNPFSPAPAPQHLKWVKHPRIQTHREQSLLRNRKAHFQAPDCPAVEALVAKTQTETQGNGATPLPGRRDAAEELGRGRDEREGRPGMRNGGAGSGMFQSVVERITVLGWILLGWASPSFESSVSRLSPRLICSFPGCCEIPAILQVSSTWFRAQWLLSLFLFCRYYF